MQILGIIGGVASGKSLATEIFAELGAAVLSGDAAAHDVLQYPAVISAAEQRWGGDLLDADGQINRGRLAAIVFDDTPSGVEELGYLENMVHPLIGERLQAQLDVLKAMGTKLVVLDAAVLLKAGWDRYCDRILFLDAPQEIRQARALRRGWSADEMARREAQQLPIDAKRSRADWTIDNSGTPDQLRSEIQRLWDSLFESQMPN